MDMLVLATAAFLATHFVTSTPLRPALVGAIGEWPYRGLYSLVAFVTLAWMIWAYVKAPREALYWTPLRLLGLVSYTFYLVHEAALDIAGDRLGFPVGSLGRGLAGFAFAVFLSGACYVLVERRFAALRRKLHGKPAPHAV